jgi:hypothetical protein
MSDAFERAAARAEDEDRRRRRERPARGQRDGFRFWALTGAGYPWFLFPLAGWGAGLGAHYAAVHDSFKGT